MNRKKIILLSILAFSFILMFLIFIQKNNLIENASNKKIFYKVELNDELKRVETSSGGIFIKLKNNPNEYMFYHNIKKDIERFNYAASIGDSVFKTPNSFQLTLKTKDGKMYNYDCYKLN